MRVFAPKHRLGMTVCAPGAAVDTLDFATARKFFKVAADGHIGYAERIGDFLNRNGSLGVKQLAHLVLTFGFDHLCSSFARFCIHPT